ncbi:MAG: DUF3486 family protein [Gemmatimonadota bacterium]|nr:DUF3486 family protein [Gemmatimonadota bacterium]
MAGRSTLELLPPAILAAVHEAIVEGATIDEIVRRIRAHGGSCSRSAVVRYVKRARETLRTWRAEKGLADFWLKSLGEQPEGGTGPLALEAVRSLAMRTASALGGNKEPPAVDQIATLALALQRIEGAVRGGAERESAAAGNPTRLKGWPRSPEEQKKGLSPDAVAHIRAAVEGYWGIRGHEEEEWPDGRAPETRRLGPA